MIRIIEVTQEGDELETVRSLFSEYQAELNTDLQFQDFGSELKNPLAKYGAPNGILFLAYWNHEPAGCIAFTSMSEAGNCEMKRLYVRPAFRKYGIGRALSEKLIHTAIEKGFRYMRLDTFRRLQSAIRLYHDLGFFYIQPYYHNPFDDVVFMEKKLQ